MQICIIMTQTVQGYDPDRICILVQHIHITVVNMTYNHHFYPQVSSFNLFSNLELFPNNIMAWSN